MPDKYPDFATLAQHERSGVDYRVLVRRDTPAFAITAPHGGGIEPGTSEIADAIAGETFSFYAFEGLKERGNTDLHITSTRFDEPMCLMLLGTPRSSSPCTVKKAKTMARGCSLADWIAIWGLRLAAS